MLLLKGSMGRCPFVFRRRLGLCRLVEALNELHGCTYGSEIEVTSTSQARFSGIFSIRDFGTLVVGRSESVTSSDATTKGSIHVLSRDKPHPLVSHLFDLQGESIRRECRWFPKSWVRLLRPGNSFIQNISLKVLRGLMATWWREHIQPNKIGAISTVLNYITM